MKLHKKFGQHFLKNENICKQIVQHLNTSAIKNVLEIGPGGGALTKYIIQLPNINFKAYEIDQEKISFLQMQYPVLNNKIEHIDILKSQQPFVNTFNVIGNFPYNISTEIVFKLIEWQQDIEIIIAMFQKEVADRLMALPNTKTYGVTSIFMQNFFNIQHVMDITPNEFNPPPKVMSSVIKLTKKQNPIVPIEKFPQFKILVKQTFQQRRKQLRNSLKTLIDANHLHQDIFNQRPENLTIQDFYFLMDKMNVK